MKEGPSEEARREPSPQAGDEAASSRASAPSSSSIADAPRSSRRALGLDLARAVAGASTAIVGVLGFLAARPKPVTGVLLGVDANLAAGVTLTDELIVISRPGEPPLALSRRCPHLGCRVVRDEHAGGYLCPCHGSRFDLEGRVMLGPAPRDLETVRLDTSPDGGLRIIRGSG